MGLVSDRGGNIMKAETWVVVLLRLEGVILLMALGAVVMPFSWMSAASAALGLGELSSTPLLEYLTRSLSALYATLGPLHLYLAAHVRRYLDLIVFFSWVKAVFGIGMLLLDVWAGLPLFWTACEGPTITGFSLLVIVLLRQHGAGRSASVSGEGSRS